jgi:hypothetical protein
MQDEEQGMVSSQFDPGDSDEIAGDPLGHALDQGGLLTTHDEEDADISASETADGSTEGEVERLENAAIDNVLDEFVDLVNARDFDAVLELCIAEVEAPFLDAGSAADVADGLADLVLRYPTMILTRGELGDDPVIGVWIFRQGEDAYGLAGYLTALLTDDDEPLIERLELVDELDDEEDLVVETPDADEIPEWEALADRDQF